LLLGFSFFLDCIILVIFHRVHVLVQNKNPLTNSFVVASVESISFEAFYLS
jgi:hypothetical protein